MSPSTFSVLSAVSAAAPLSTTLVVKLREGSVPAYSFRSTVSSARTASRNALVLTLSASTSSALASLVIALYFAPPASVTKRKL